MRIDFIWLMNEPVHSQGRYRLPPLNFGDERSCIIESVQYTHTLWYALASQFTLVNETVTIYIYILLNFQSKRENWVDFVLQRRTSYRYRARGKIVRINRFIRDRSHFHFIHSEIKRIECFYFNFPQLRQYAGSLRKKTYIDVKWKKKILFPAEKSLTKDILQILSMVRIGINGICIYFL